MVLFFGPFYLSVLRFSVHLFFFAVHFLRFSKLINIRTAPDCVLLLLDIFHTQTMTDFSLSGQNVNVGFMTSGGLAPCLSSSISQLARYWVAAYKSGEISGLTLRMYVDGYKGVLTGDSFVVPESEWDGLEALNFLGGSPIGNSRVKVRKKKRNDWHRKHD